MKNQRGSWERVGKVAQESILATLKIEKGYANLANDSGGETMWGITEYNARRAGWELSMEAMPYEWALDYYAFHEWESNNYDKLNAYPNLQDDVFDFGVNAGHSRSVKTLQQAVNLCNRQQRDYADIKVDGKLGKNTAKACTDLIKRRGLQHALRVLNVGQGKHYWDLALRKETQEDFFNGWVDKRVSYE